MSIVQSMAKNTCQNIFKNMFNDVKTTMPDVKLENLQLGIYYENGQHFYGIYINNNRIKQIQLSKFVGAVDKSSIIDATVAQLGTQYAKKLNCNLDSILIILNYNPNNSIKCDDLKAREKAAGFFAKVKPTCNCKICLHEGFPSGNLLKNNEYIEDIVLKQFLN